VNSKRRYGLTLVVVIPLVFIGVLFYFPLGRILSMGFGGGTIAAITTHRIAGIVWFTIWQAFLSAVIALILGIPGAYLLYNRRFKGQKFLRAIITVPFVLPTIVVAIGFTSLRTLPLVGSLFSGSSMIPAIICAHVFMNYSLIVRGVGSMWSTLDSRTEDAAALDGAGRLRTLWSVTLPQLRAAIISAFSLVFIYCLASFGIILVLGGGLINSIETEIFTAATQFLDLTKTTGLAIVQMAVTAVAFLIAQRATRKSVMIEAVDSESIRKHVDRRDWLAVMLTGVVVVFLIGLPVISVLVRAFIFQGNPSLMNFGHLGGFGARDLLSITVGQAAMNSVRNLIISLTLTMIISLLVSYVISRSSGNARFKIAQRVLDILFQIPIGVSAVVLGFGYLVTFSGGIFPLRSSWLVVPLVQSLLATPLVIRFIYPALLSIDRELLDAAAVDSASASQSWWHIELPLIRTSITTAFGYAAIISIGEFGAASFLAYGDQGTLPTVLYQLISRPGEQNYGMAMATSALLILLAFLTILLISAPKARTLTKTSQLISRGELG
jgi:thiamine transport system permease protein